MTKSQSVAILVALASGLSFRSFDGAVVSASAAIRTQRPVPQVSSAPDSEVAALRLLGKARVYESAGCSSITELVALGPRIEAIMSTRDVLGLSEIVKEGAAKCPGYQFVITVTENPSVTAIQKIFGKLGQTEDGRLELGTSSQNVTWHKYAWLHFAVVEGKVIAVRGDSRGFSGKAPKQ